jgi:hypothetical protein
VRKIIALTAAAGLLVTLAACSTSAPTGTCTPSLNSGKVSDTVVADGAFGQDPDADFPTPLVATSIEVTTLVTGDGDTVFDGEYARSQVTLYDGKTGAYMASTSYEEAAAFLMRAGESSSNLGTVLECRTVGSRIAATITGEDLYGFQGIAEGSLGADATFVVVFDIQGSVPGKSYGVDQIPQQGLPSVVVAPNGAPGVTVPSEAPPTSVKFSVLKQGDGAAVAEGDTIYAHYLRLSWENPKDTSSTKSTWADFGVPDELSLTTLDPTTGLGVTAGLKQALIGQKVGSQVVVVVPPAFGFPDGTAPEGVDTTETQVYVIDILGVK